MDFFLGVQLHFTINQKKFYKVYTIEVQAKLSITDGAAYP